MKKVIIVGGGIAGLSAGIYALQSGFDVTILEMHTIPGGNSTSWRRGGYFFEGGMHWLTGSSKGNPIYKVWANLGALSDDVSVYNRDPFVTYLDSSQNICLYRDVNKLEKHLLSISQADIKEIKSLCKNIRKFSAISMPVTDIKGVTVKYKDKQKGSMSKLFKMLTAIPTMISLNKMSTGEFAGRYRHRLIRELLSSVVPVDYNATSLIFTLATLATGDGGYPEGGSLSMAQRMAKSFERLGGKINYNTLVQKVLVKKGKAVGVLVDDKEILADAVVVTVDTLSAIDKLFDDPLHDGWMDVMRERTKLTMNSFICLGIEADLSDLPENMVMTIDEPFTYAGSDINTIGFNNYATYKGYAPKGCTSVTMALTGDTYDYWKNAKEQGTYYDEKKRLAEVIIDRLSSKLPQIKDKVVVWDVATPLTFERYCGTYKGSWMTVMGKGSKMISYPTTSESIASLYFAGQRMQPPGGLPVAAVTGRTAIQYLCRDTNTVFQGNI
ncbi:MAG: NAD(P)/FAD-dependent oxidoreductase [Clostridiales bacterium]|nr:NAD(P)/FAD-dependent oxidoreductase [Clostridiales bacterium]